MDAILTAMQMLALESADILFDLGCGDGRFLIAVSIDSITFFRYNKSNSSIYS